MPIKLLIRSFVLVAAVATGAQAQTANEIMPLDQVKPGMKGVGRTVFAGSKIETFDVEIIGVLENAVAPKHSMVMAKLSGGPLANTGVIAGMSGSPVYIDGKLLGAVAYGFPFSKETIAGITPAGDMIAATATGAPRSAATRLSFPTQPPTREGLFNPQVFRQVLAQRLAAVPLASGVASRTMAPLALPLNFAGFDNAAFGELRSLFADAGFAPVLGGSSSSSASAEPLPPLEPGSPVGVSLVEGDVDLSATGTVTFLDGDRVYAFGHPFYNLGPTQFPMKKAYVFGVFPSVYQSWKIANARELIGTLDQDRTTAVAGRLGPAPRMIPVKVQLSTGRGEVREFSFRMVDDELFSPLLAYASLFSVLQSNERAMGTSTMKVVADISFSGGRKVHLEDLYTEEQPALHSATLVAAPLAYILSNNFETVDVESVNVKIASEEKIQSAMIERAWIEAEGPVRPGATLPVRILLRSYRGDNIATTMPLKIPDNTRDGTYQVLVADSTTLDLLDQRDPRKAFTPRNLDQLLRAINSFRPSSRIYARLSRAGEGAFVSGEYLPSLPPSVLAVLRGAERGAGDMPLRSMTLAEQQLDTDLAVSGSRTLSVTVKR